MSEQTVTHNTFVIERTYPKPPETVFAAFANAGTKRRWFGESDNHTIEHYEMNFEVGGMEHARYRFNERTPFPGAMLTNEMTYEDIVPDQRIVFAQRMAIGEKRISAALVTFEFLPSGSGGTDLICTHQAAFFEGADGPEMRQDGWRRLLDNLGTRCLEEK